MAAPTVSARVVPPGATSFKLPDGFQSTISFNLKPNIQFWEKNLAWPGLDGGEPIQTTTMLNTLWRTFAPRKLRTLTPFTVNAAYDPDVYSDLLVFINRPDSITFHFPENSSLCFYGYLQKFVPQELQEGEMPLAALTIVPTNYDWINNVEAAPLFTMATGT